MLVKKITERMQRTPLELAQPAGATREAAVLVALTREADPRVVFIKRAEHLTNHSGEVAFPGGMWEPGDQHLLHTALRECEEEVALPSHAVEVIAKLGQQKTRVGILVTPYVGLFDPAHKLYPDPTELEAVFSVPLSFLLNPGNMEMRSFHVFDGAHALPCICYNGYTIWGFTLTVLVKFLNQSLLAGLELNYDSIKGHEFQELVK